MLLPAALDELARSHPNLRINATVDNWKNLLELLHAEQLDFLIVDIRGVPSSSKLDTVALPRHRAAWFVREGHPLTGHDPIQVQQLSGYPIISVPLPEAMRESLRKWLRFPPKQEMEFHLTCNDVNVLREYARKTDALLLLTEQTAWERGRLAGLVALSVPSRSHLWLCSSQSSIWLDVRCRRQPSRRSWPSSGGGGETCVNAAPGRINVENTLIR